MNPFFQPGINQGNNFNNLPLNNNFNNNQTLSLYSLNNFTEIKELGHGCFGCVLQVRDNSNGMIYALKKLKQEQFKKGTAEKDFFREKSILYTLTAKKCPNIVKLYGDFQDQNYRYLVMEYVEGKSLAEIIKDCKNKQTRVPQDLVIHILEQLLTVLKFLHNECHIIHRDIKPDNIILDSNKNIKLLDFGLAVYLEHENHELVSQKSFKGALNFVPPEILFYPSPLNYNYKVDVFALGYTIFNLMNPGGGKYNLPQTTTNNQGNIIRIDNPIENTFYEKWLVAFVACLYENRPTERRSAGGALQLLHGFQTNNSFHEKFAELYLKEQKKKLANNSNFNLNRRNSNVNNAIFTNISPPNNMIKSMAQNSINNPLEVNKNINRLNSEIVQDNKKSEVEEFLQPNAGKEKRIISSMKSLIHIFQKSDIINFILAELDILMSQNSQNQSNYQNLFVKSFKEILYYVSQWNNGFLSKDVYDQKINEFIINVFQNNSSDTTGTRPLILYFMISSIFRKEFLTNFADKFKNTIFDDIIKSNNYSCFQNIVPINNPKIVNNIKEHLIGFQKNYIGPFVDNFYFLISYISKCPHCKSYCEVIIHPTQFLQLSAPAQPTHIDYILADYFAEHSGRGIYYCSACNMQGNKIKNTYCLNLPNYLILEFEDKNQVLFNDIIKVPLYNGNYYKYQYFAGIYKRKTNGVSNFVAVIKSGNFYYFYSDDTFTQCDEKYMSLECPSLIIFKKIIDL